MKKKKAALVRGCSGDLGCFFRVRSRLALSRAADVGTTRRHFGQSSRRRTFTSVASAPPLRDQQVQQMVRRTRGESLGEKTFHFRVTVFVQSGSKR